MAGKTRITSSNQKVKTPKEKKKMLSYSPLFISVYVFVIVVISFEFLNFG